MSEPDHEGLARELARSNLAMLVGGVDTGKTTLAFAAARLAVSAGRTVALVDGPALG